MKNILIIIMIGTFIYSCRQKQNYTITGVLYTNCSKSVTVKNVNIQISETQAGMGSTSTIASGQTDNNGYFSITYTTTQPSTDVFLTSQSSSGAGFTELGNVPYGNQSGLELFIRPETEVQIKVQTNRTFTQNDTLYYYSFNNSQARYVVNPQNNQILEIRKGLFSKSSIATWGLGYNDYRRAMASPSNAPYNQIRFVFPACGRNLDCVINIQ